jgi:3-oxoacyl-[acyl-carrier-protein] synthase-1
MRHALSDAGLTADDIDYINAHATGTPQGDSIEAEAITQLLGKNTAHAWVSSTKSMTGHECWMAGASEAIYSTIMMQRGFVAPNINLDNADEAAAHLRIPRVATEADLRVVMSNSFGFGGTNSTLILSRNQGVK